MKNTYFFFFLLVCIVFLSCENKEKYYGKWIIKSEYFSSDEIYKIEVSKDSIFFVPGELYNHKISYPLKINQNKFYFKDTVFDASIENDTLLHFNKTTYINSMVCKDIPIYNHDNTQFVKIDFARLKNQKKVTSINATASFIYYGKKPNTNEYVLQLNDRFYTENFKDIKSFLFSEDCFNCDLNPVIFIADKDAPMKKLANIFFEIRSLLNPKMYFITDHNLAINDSLKLSYQFKGIIKRLAPPFPEEIKHSHLPPFPTDKEFTLQYEITNHNYVISLINDEFYVGLNNVSKDKLVEILKEKIMNEQPTFLNLFDDTSIYSSYLEFLNSFDVAYKSVRNKESLKVFKKEYHQLNKKERRQIIKVIPRKIFDGLSYSQFKKLDITIPELQLVSKP